MIVENIIPRNMIINLGCASVDYHISRDDIFDYHPLRECNIYIIYIWDVPFYLSIEHSCYFQIKSAFHPLKIFTVLTLMKCHIMRHVILVLTMTIIKRIYGSLVYKSFISVIKPLIVFLIKFKRNIALFELLLYIPVNKFSVMSGRVLLG